METRPTALLTGASKGIGSLLAELLAPDYNLILAYCSDRRGAQQVALRCLARGARRVNVLPLDLSDSSSIESFADLIRQEPRPIDLVVQNAGVLVKGVLEDQSAEDIKRQLLVNLFGPMLLTYRLLPKINGKTVFIGSDVGVEAIPGMAPYCASKYGIRAFAHELAREFNLRTICINPDKTATQMNDGEGRDVRVVAEAIHACIASANPEEGVCQEFHLNEVFAGTQVA